MKRTQNPRLDRIRPCIRTFSQSSRSCLPCIVSRKSCSLASREIGHRKRSEFLTEDLRSRCLIHQRVFCFRHWKNNSVKLSETIFTHHFSGLCDLQNASAVFAYNRTPTVDRPQSPPRPRMTISYKCFRYFSPFIVTNLFCECLSKGRPSFLCENNDFFVLSDLLVCRLILF